MTLPSTATTYSVTVPGARLHYEARGTGPLVLIIGSPMASADFAPLADALAGDHTVVTYDPRGHAASTIEDLQEESTPESRADDIAAILDDLGAESADVFGSSGGAVTGLALVVRHPGRVRTLVAHEPPLLELLPEAARFFDHGLRPTTHYPPDIDTLNNGPSRVVIGVGADSRQLLTYGTSVALCELLGSTPVEFPGDHGGFLGATTAFADTLRTVLS